ncbi:MAG TPA: sulfotransferase, partial [Candidatus Obscuribacterales bacterium]
SELFKSFNKLIGPERAKVWWMNHLTNDAFVENTSDKILRHFQGLPMARWAEAAQDYLNHMESLADRKGYALIVNKMPANFQYLGLIQVLFPNAIVIHCRRHPLDTSLSCYSIDFKHLQWTNDIEKLGRYYADYQRVMAHWKEHLDIPILEVPYEETIADQEAMSRRLIAWCGLEWDERCMSFHKQDRHVKTASFEQVRKPIYKTSVARYKPYETQLEPLKQWIDLHEYDSVS